jgi:hypothetical protein
VCVCVRAGVLVSLILHIPNPTYTPLYYQPHEQLTLRFLSRP